MSAPGCPRRFEAGAMRDGRLAGAELASYERHLTACAACTEEVRALEALGAAVRASSAGETDELHVRRERTRLLAAFDRELVAPPRRGPALRWFAVPAIAAALVAVVLVVRPSRSPSAPEPAPIAAVSAGASAIWSRQTTADTDRIRLDRGSLRIHVDHAAERGRVLVLLPDGEMEDIGTTFSVTVTGGRTTHVAVDDGSVILRLRGAPPLTIAAGRTWTQQEPPVASAVTSPAASAAVATTASAASPVESLPAASAGSAPASVSATATRRPRATEPAPVTTSEPAGAIADQPDPSSDFRAAMASLRAGNHSAAAAAFGAFLAKYPRDSRGEDAAYLRVIALQKAGDPAGARRAAQDYLRRYPSGFRRADVERLAR